jgi:nicotinamidase-related amidase
LIAGEASSHCVANTAADVIEAFGDPAYASKITLITDCMSAVTGFDFLWDGFIAKYGQRVKFATAAEVIKSLV